MHSILSSARASAILSVVLMTGACATDEAPESELEEAQAESKTPPDRAIFNFTMESGEELEMELVRHSSTRDEDRVVFRSNGREYEMRTRYGRPGDVVLKGQKILQNGRVVAESTRYADGKIVVKNERGAEFRGQGGLELDEAQTAQFDLVAIALLSERTRQGLMELDLASPEEPEECVICLGIALCCLKLNTYWDCDSEGNCGSGGSIGFDCTCL